MAQKTDAELLVQAAEIKDETTALANTATRVGTMLEDIIDSKNSSEFERAFSAELLFDKNEIKYAPHELTGDLEYTIAAAGHLANQFSSAMQIIETDGTRTVTFTGFDFVLGDIQSGSMPDAGTYLVLFLYANGVATVNWTKPSLEVANLAPLSAPANFAAVPGAGDPETQVDLSWDAVTNVSSYEIYYSTTSSSGPWISLTNPAAAATSYTHTGLTAGTTYYYRIRAIGDQVAFANSGYSTGAATTEDSGDITAPTFAFTLPYNSSNAAGATDVPMNAVVIITSTAPLRDQDGTTAIINANLGDYLIVKEDDGAGANIPYTATIDATKTIITITPNVIWPALGDVFVEIDGVESSVNGVHAVADDATFTTNDYTLMNANYLNLGSQFDAIVTGNDVNWEFEYDFKDAVFAGVRGLFQKETATQKSFILYTDDDDVVFTFYGSVSAPTGIRTITWPNALSGVTDGKITFKYLGATDTNNGLDRVELYIDDVLITAGKALTATGTMVWPFAIQASTASLYISGPTFREVRDAFIRNNFGATVQGSYPIIRTGEDQSGNNRDGTWL